MTKVLERASPALAAPLQPKSEAEHEQTENASWPTPASAAKGRAAVFLGLKLVGLMAALFLGGGTVMSVKGITPNALLDRRRAGHDLLLPARPGRRLSGQEPEASHLPRPARRPGPDGGLRRGRTGTGPCHAQGQRRE